MTRQEAFQTLQVYTKSQNLIRHHLACEAAMRAIAKAIAIRKKDYVNEEEWALTGLLHDADYELTRDHPEQHTLLLEEKIGNILPKEVMHAIKAHNYRYNNVQPVSNMDWAIYTCDELTGFVIACALVTKTKRLSDVNVDFVQRKMQETSFAKAVDRTQISACENQLGIPIREYIQIVLSSMQAIATDLGFEG